MPKLTMKHLYFCRHGESELNAAGKRAGTTDTPLTAEGREQAKQAGKSAQNLHIDYILCSPLSRAHDTAQIIAEAIGYPLDKIEVNSLVIEQHFGSVEGQPWHPDLDLDGIVDAETADSVIERARLLLKHLETIEADSILIVSHGGFGRALRHVLHPEIPFRGPGSDGFGNATIVKLI